MSGLKIAARDHGANPNSLSAVNRILAWTQQERSMGAEARVKAAERREGSLDARRRSRKVADSGRPSCSSLALQMWESRIAPSLDKLLEVGRLLHDRVRLALGRDAR